MVITRDKGSDGAAEGKRRGGHRLRPAGAAVACAIGFATLAMIFAAPGQAAASISAERITSYDARIAIRPDGSILVTEQITYDFGTDQRHGIFRVIPVRFRYNDSYDRIYPVGVRSVQSQDAPHQYTVQNNGSSVSIKIGDPNLTITGQHTYTLTYLVRGSLNAFAGHDELYWNAIGNRWNVPIDHASVAVSAPAAVTRAACFSGPPGSTISCQQASITDGIAHFRQAGLGPREGLTVVVAIPTGVAASPGPVLLERWTLQRAFSVTPVSGGIAGGLLIVVLVAGAMLARRRNRWYSGPADQVGHGQPPMELAPPAGLRPGQVSTLLDGAANPRDVTATIVDLAVRGYLRIEDAPPHQIRPDWRLVRLGKTGGLLKYERILLDGLFESGTTRSDQTATLLSELGPDFARQLKQAQNALYADVAARGWFTVRPDLIRRTWFAIGSFVFLAGVVAVIVAAAGTHHLGLAPVPVVLAGLLLIAGARWMPARTAKGTALARRVEQFRRSIQTPAVTEAQPAGQPDTPYDYLPYAIAFGCTQQWADVTAALAGQDGAPSWYSSGQPFLPATLGTLPRSAYYFSTFHHFATNTSNWIGSHASGSGGSGFGGFSGGGGGGGGGGSW